MRSVNKVILIGNLTRDPEKKQTGSGQDVVTFGIATNREWITRDNRKMDSAEYHEVVAWAKLAEICSRYLKKGKLVYVEGYLKTRTWDNPDGTRKFRTEIVAQDIIMLDRRSEGEDEDEPEQTPAPQAAPLPKQSMPEKQPEKKEPQAVAAPPSAPPEKPENKEALDIDSDLGL